MVGLGAGGRILSVVSDLEAVFPGLRETDYSLTSPVDNSYNCIAWAAEDMSHWWWPDPAGQYFWPSGAPRELTVGAFASAYAGLGYEQCDSAYLESGFEKIAVFVSRGGHPTHAARQLQSGRWTSKLGRNVDIEHDLHALEGDTYGAVAVIMKRSQVAR